MLEGGRKVVEITVTKKMLLGFPEVTEYVKQQKCEILIMYEIDQLMTN